MALNACMGAIFMLASVVVQAKHCSSGDECPSDEQSQGVVSLLQTKLHDTSLRFDSAPDKQDISSSFTNGGTFTLQGRVIRLPPPLTIVADPKEEYATFVHKMVSAFKERPLMRDALGYFLDNIATRDSAGQGEWVEFGVFEGGCIRAMSNKRKALGSSKVIHGFDSFLGLPSKWRDTGLGQGFEDTYLNKGSFNMGGKPPFDEPNNFRWHEGWFNETVAPFAHDPSIGNITFAHMDADMYISTAQAFEGIERKLAPGVFIAFDELLGYPEYEANEMKALYELAKRSGRAIKVIGYRGGGQPLREDPTEVKNVVQLHGETMPQDALVQLV